MFRYCTEDIINNDSILHKTKTTSTKDSKARQRTAKTSIIQPPWWTKSVNQALVKETATKVCQMARKNRIRNEEDVQSY